MRAWLFIAALGLALAGILHLALVLHGPYIPTWFANLEVHRFWWGLAVIASVISLVRREAVVPTTSLLSIIVVIWIIWELVLSVRGHL